MKRFATVLLAAAIVWLGQSYTPTAQACHFGRRAVPVVGYPVAVPRVATVRRVAYGVVSPRVVVPRRVAAYSRIAPYRAVPRYRVANPYRYGRSYLYGTPYRAAYRYPYTSYRGIGYGYGRTPYRVNRIDSNSGYYGYRRNPAFLTPGQYGAYRPF